MRRVFPWFFLGLVAAAIWLGATAWRQRVERDEWQQRIAAATRKVRLAGAKQIARGPAAALAENAALPPPGPPVAPAHPGAEPKPKPAPNPERDRLVAAKSQRGERLNALTGYDEGFTKLDVAPEKVARAKEIILARWETAARERKNRRSMEEMMVLARATEREMANQLIALVGPDTYEHLEAYHQESRFDWTIGTDMWDGGAPLSADQLHALTLAIVRTKFEPGNIAVEPQPAQAPDPTTGLSSQDIVLLAAGNQFLTPAQREILRRHLIDDNRYNAAMRGFAAKQRAMWKKGP